ncbi:MAG: DUF2283 domain-containing protein [Lentisphaerae bacterium]|nr:DUF2283 domain-containing protein [Lentisphaerota bacterium]
MDKVKIYYHKETDTMDIWFGNPSKEVVSEEVGGGVVLKKDKKGRVIGLEKLYLMKSLKIKPPLPVEVVVA